MFGRRLVLFHLLGFKVQADASWLLLALLVTWSLATGYFPTFVGGLSTATYWTMGLAGMVGLFVSILLHELSHSVVARRYGLPIQGITLFIFGGVAEMTEEPADARTEFLMAIAGPLASLALAGGFYLLAEAGAAGGLPATVLAVSRYLAFINGVLALFNLVPAFPLDGGRMLRAALWSWKGDLRWSTKVAARSGEIFGAGLIVLGLFSVLTGNLVAGMWWFLIGLFLRSAAGASYLQMMTRRALAGAPLARFMTRDPIAVDPDLTLDALIEDYVYRYHHDLFPVARDGRALGLVTIKHIKAVPRLRWPYARVAEVMEPRSPDNSIAAGADTVAALGLMQRSGKSRLLVVEGDRLVGIVALKDLLAFLSLTLDLEPEGGR